MLLSADSQEMGLDVHLIVLPHYHPNEDLDGPLSELNLD